VPSLEGLAIENDPFPSTHVLGYDCGALRATWGVCGHLIFFTRFDAHLLTPLFREQPGVDSQVHAAGATASDNRRLTTDNGFWLRKYNRPALYFRNLDVAAAKRTLIRWA